MKSKLVLAMLAAVKTLTAATEVTKPVNYLDTTYSVPGEILPVYTQPNLLESNWEVVVGKMKTDGSIVRISNASGHEKAIIFSNPIKVEAGSMIGSDLRLVIND